MERPKKYHRIVPTIPPKDPAIQLFLSLVNITPKAKAEIRQISEKRIPNGSIAGCASPISRTGKNEARISLTLAQLLAILRAMRAACRTVALLRAALSTRRDLLLEMLALRHQLGVFRRSDRRFRPSDRLLWVCLRRYANFQNMPTRPAHMRWQAARGMTTSAYSQ